MQKSFIAQQGQSVLDLALYAYGDSSEVIKLASENPGLDINARTYAGEKINYTPTPNTIKSRLSLTNIIPASASFEGTNQGVLLQENGFDILLEDGSKIDLE